MSELLSCPFCGGEAHISASSDGYGVECWNRRCIDMQMDELPTEAEAIAAWNSRADYHGYEQAAIEAWESIKAWNSRAERTCEFTPDGMMDDRLWFACSNCGGYITTDYGMPSYCPHCGARTVGE